MQLILFSLEDVVPDAAGDDRDTAALAERAEGLLRRDFLLHLHTLDYWRLPNSDQDDQGDQGDEDVFTLTPLARRVWDECYKPEHGRWLHD